MNIDQKLKKIFSDSLQVELDEITDDLGYASIPQWDSIAHMSLIAHIEEVFEILIDAEDVLDISSFVKAKEIVAKYL